MMSSKLRIATLSSEVRVFSAVVFTITFRAATTSNPFMSSVTQAQRLCNSASDALQLWLRALWVLRAEEERSACRVL